jgi:hypothetical protein
LQPVLLDKRIVGAEGEEEQKVMTVRDWRLLLLLRALLMMEAAAAATDTVKCRPTLTLTEKVAKLTLEMEV